MCGSEELNTGCELRTQCRKARRCVRHLTEYLTTGDDSEPSNHGLYVRIIDTLARGTTRVASALPKRWSLESRECLKTGTTYTCVWYRGPNLEARESRCLHRISRIATLVRCVCGSRNGGSEDGGKGVQKRTKKKLGTGQEKPKAIFWVLPRSCRLRCWI